jgi:hypothetical protein
MQLKGPNKNQNTEKYTSPKHWHLHTNLHDTRAQGNIIITTTTTTIMRTEK